MTELAVVDQLAPLILQHSTRLATLWSFQIVVALGIIGWIFNHKEDLKNYLHRSVVIVLLGAFGCFTWFSVESTTNRKHAAWDALVAEIVTVREKSGSSKTNQKICEVELGKQTALTVYVCTLKPHGLDVKAWALLLGNLLIILFVALAPSDRWKGIRAMEDGM